MSDEEINDPPVIDILNTRKISDESRTPEQFRANPTINFPVTPVVPGTELRAKALEAVMAIGTPESTADLLAQADGVYAWLTGESVSEGDTGA